MRKKPPHLVIYPSRVKTLVLLATCAAMLLVPILALLFLRDRIEESKVVSGRLHAAIWLGIGFFLLCGTAGALFNLRQLVSPRPVVTISGEGIEPIWCGLIEWDEIDHLAKARCNGQWLLGIYPKNVDELLSRRPRLRRGLITRAIDQGFPPVYVTQLALPMPVDEVLADIRRYTDVPISKSSG